MKKSLIASSIALISLGLAATAQAQTWPERPVKITTTFPVGAGPDVALRLIADKLGKKWGKPVVVENRAGGNGFIAIDAVKRSAADGYTLLQMDNAQTSAQPWMFKNLPYSLLKDFDVISPIFRNYFFVTVPANSKYQSVADIVKEAKARPTDVNYGSWFVGSPGHIGGAMLEDLAGVKMTHIPYKDFGQLYAAVSNGELDWAFGSAGSAGPLMRAGKLKFLAVSAPARDPQFPDIPTVDESAGLKGFETMGSTALYAPKGTPEAVVQKINADLADVLKDPDVLKTFNTMFYEAYPLSTKDFAKAIEEETEAFGKVLKKLNISMD